MEDFKGNTLRLGDRVVTVKRGGPAFVAGEVIKITPSGAKILTDRNEIDGVAYGTDNGVVLQRAGWVIHLIEHNPAREAELLAPTIEEL